MRTFQACEREILHSGDPRTHAPNDASEGKGTVIYTRAGKQLLLRLDDALEDFSFQKSMRTRFLLLVDDNFLAHWADIDNDYTVQSMYPLARLTSDGSGQKVCP